MSKQDENENSNLWSFIIPLVIGGVFGYFICQFTAASEGEMPMEGTVDLSAKLISNEEAFSMIDAFQNSNNDSVSVTSGHIPLAELMAYIGHINTLTTENSTDSITGLEYYFGKYGSEVPLEVKADSHQQTIILYPTYWNQTEEQHRPFDPTRLDDGSAVEIENLRAGSPLPINSSTNIAFNRSNMVPPRWND